MTLWLPPLETATLTTADGKGKCFPSFSMRHESRYCGALLIRWNSGFQRYHFPLTKERNRTQTHK